MVDEYARGLIALAGSPDTRGPARIAVALPNSIEFAALVLATLRAGLIAVPVNPGYTAREFGEVLDESGATTFIGTSDVLATVATIADDLPDLVHACDVADPRLRRADGSPVTSTVSPEDIAVLLYTSGSLGRPRGAMLSHRAILANHQQLAQIHPTVIGPNDIALLAVPLFHAYGLNSGLGAIVYHGATGVLADAFDPEETLRAMQTHRVSMVIGVPPMFRAWSAQPDFAAAFASVRIAVSGAAQLSTDIAAAFAPVVARGLDVGYGLTETAPVLTTTLVGPVAKPGSIGRPIPGVELTLSSAAGETIWTSASAAVDDVDDFDDDASGSPGTDPGEIVVRGPNLFSGYWPDRREGPDADGWWATGDVAYADADGDLYIVDRLGELIIVNGFNVYPIEVEQVLTAHPAVAEAAAIGVPDPATGASVQAFVVTSEPVTTDELLLHCRRNLARYKCPAVIEVLPELPHSATGKVRKGALRSAAAADV